MARFRCCGNHSTAGHAATCSMKPPDYQRPVVTQTEDDRRERETGCQFDILRFQHIGECKGTCDEEPETIQFQDPNTLVIVLVEIDPNDEQAEQKLKELERRGFRRLSENDLRNLVELHERGEVQLRVESMTLDQFEEKTRAPEIDDPYLSISQCADILGFSKSWVRELCRRGRFEGAIKLIGKWAVPQSAVLLPD